DVYSANPKKISHYIDKDSEGKTRIYYDRFLDKYRDDILDPFLLGYYCHLISDQVWLDKIYFPYIKFLPPDEKKLAQQQNYRDFGRLNGRLFREFKVQFEDNLLKEPIVNIDEIDVSSIPQLLLEVRKDARTGLNNDPLELLKMEDIYSFVHEATK